MEYVPKKRIVYFLLAVFSPFVMYKLFTLFSVLELAYINDIFFIVMIIGVLNVVLCRLGFIDFLSLYNVRFFKKEITNISQKEFLIGKTIQYTTSDM